jgi:metal transporter CNNM
VTVIKGIFSIHTKTVQEIYKPLDKVFMLPFNTTINLQMTQQIYELGFSRIPVYFGARQNIMGVFLSKQLIKHDPD